jgi:hypothetical protein
MAIRIPVVISQHERRSGAVADYEEQLITRLIFENGLDATLIADLKAIGLDTTDHLCIEGLKGDFALATWESMEYVCQHLHRLGMPSLELLPVDGSQRVVSVQDPSVSPKKVFYVALTVATPIDSTIKTLRALREARQTPVFSIGLQSPKGSASRSEPAVHSIAAVSKPMSNTSESSHPVSQEPIGNTPASGTSDKSVAANASPALAKPAAKDSVSPLHVLALDDDDFPHIDQLMDDLDRFEI